MSQVRGSFPGSTAAGANSSLAENIKLVSATTGIRGGVPAMTELAILRDVDKARMEQQRSQLAIGVVVPLATTTI